MVCLNDVDVLVMVLLVLVRWYVYFSLIVYVEEDDEDDVRMCVMGMLSVMVVSVGLDVSVARALESVVSGTSSASARVLGMLVSLLLEVLMKDFEGYL